MNKIIRGAGILLVLSLSIAWPQTYPATLRVPVTFYDFHSNLSNPEFEAIPSSTGAGIWKGMVSDTLDAQRKPVLGSNPFFNLDIAKWFRPWVPGDTTIPNYGTPEYPLANAAGLSPKFIPVNYDTAFKNIVFQDTLTFTYVSASAGVYQFDNQNFFPLDGKGFGKESKDHNFSFTMELRWKFTMEPGLQFQFTGDDDAWAFVNNKQVIDVGGRHNAQTGAVTVDTLALVNGQDYWFDFFYCERHTNSATIKVTSNMFTPKSDSLTVIKVPALDTIAAGDSIKFSANISNNYGVPCSSCAQNVKWTITPSADSTHLNPGIGQQTTLYAISAYQSYVITAQYDNPSNTVHLVVHDTLYVTPGAADHLVLEANQDSTASLRRDARIWPEPLVFSAGMLKDSVFAVLRDKYGNWVGHATQATWLSRDTTVVTAAAGRPEWGEGVVTRQNASSDTTFILAEQGSYRDSACIVINDVAYSQIQMYALSNGAVILDTIIMHAGQDTTVHARGLRDDGSGVWDELMVSWGASSGMVFDIPPPVAGKMWTFSPKAPATGIIYVSYSSQSQVLNDTLYAFFAPSTKRNFTAWANDNINRQTGIDNDDFVLLSFDTAVEVFSVSADNIDSLLHLSNGHSWLDGAGFIGSAQWNSAGTKLLITLSTQTALPTIRTNDTITCSSVQNKAVLTGSFDPSVLSEAGMQPIAPARLIFVVQSRFAAKGLIFIFSSPAINGMKIKIFDMFGRLVSNCNVQNMQRGRSNHFMWDNKKNGSHSRMARGIYCAQVFRKDVLIQNIPFFIK